MLEEEIEDRARGEDGVPALLGMDGFLRMCFLGDCIDADGGDGG